MPYCHSCDIYFGGWVALKEHWVQSPHHSYCQHCDEHFPDDDELEDHYGEDHPYCRSCGKIFKGDVGLRDHYRQSPVHHYCAPCDRHFRSENNLQAHLNSHLHSPKNYACPFKSRGCDLKFVSRSAAILHLEAGSCCSGVDRASINREVRRLDRNNIITNPSRLLTGGDPSSDVSYSASNASWNGSAFECYLCHNTFNSLHALNQHLNSPRHQNKIYICPMNTCRSQFTTLSGLCQHIESEKCGIYKFAAVQNTMNKIVGQMRLLTF